MGKRYYCDYCDRSFQDNMHNRKKHLNGVQHHRAKKAWYDYFRDSSAILCDEQTKKPCRKFLQKGICDFGPNCRFSHMSEEDLFILKRQAEDERRHREDYVDRKMPGRSIEEWLSRRGKKQTAVGSKGDLKDKDDSEEGQEESDVPQHLLSIPDLPPSLLPSSSRRMESQSEHRMGLKNIHFVLHITMTWMLLRDGVTIKRFEINIK